MIISWTIINNEIEFIKDLYEFHSPWVDVMYFLDNGSSDGTLEYLECLPKDKVVLEKYHLSFSPDHSQPWEQMTAPFPEVEVRNHALARAESLCSEGDWLVQLDADEIFLKRTKSLIEENRGSCDIISLSTINPVCPLIEHPIENRFSKKTDSIIKMHDPHARIWKAKKGFHFAHNPAFQGKVSYHCIPVHRKVDGKISHLYHHPKNLFLNEPVHFHLHWMCYSKLERFNQARGIFNREQMVQHQKIHELSALVPKLFWDRRAAWIKEKQE